MAVGRMADAVMENVIQRSASYFFVLVLLAAGIAVGALCIRVLEPGQELELRSYVTGALRVLGEGPPITDAREAWRWALAGNVRTAAWLWILGLTVVAAPLVLVVLFLRGFVVGFTVGFLVKEMGWRGVLIAAVGVFPQNLLAVPALVVGSVICLSFAGAVLRNRLAPRRMPWAGMVAGYTLSMAVLALVFLAASFVEAYVSPTLLRLVSPLLVPRG